MGGSIDTQQIKNLLLETPDIISRHRIRLMTTSRGGQEPTSGGAGFGPRSPLNELALEMADREAEWVGKIAQLTIRNGLFKPGELDLSCFWFVNGVCRGLASSNPESDEIISRLRTVCKKLASKAEFLESFGAILILDYGFNVRELSLKEFPQEDTRWLTIADVEKQYGYKKATVYELVKSKAVIALESNIRDSGIYSMLVSGEDIEAHIRMVKTKKIEHINKVNSATKMNKCR